MVKLSVVDLPGRVAVVRVHDNGGEGVPHALRGALAAMLAEPTWHVVVAFENDDGPPRAAVQAVLDQARGWAEERQCRLTVTTLRDAPSVTGHMT